MQLGFFLIQKCPLTTLLPAAFQFIANKCCDNTWKGRRYCYLSHSLSTHLLPMALSVLLSSSWAFASLFKSSHCCVLFVVSSGLSAAVMSVFVQKCHKRDIWHRFQAHWGAGSITLEFSKPHCWFFYERNTYLLWYYFITLWLCCSFGAAGNKSILPTLTQDWK